MAQPQEQPSRSPIRSSALKMTPHTPSPSNNKTSPALASSSPSITITTLGSVDSGYESDARSGSTSIKEVPFHRRRTSSSAFSRKSSSSMNRPRSRASAYEGEVVFDPLGRQTPELSTDDPLEALLKDPTPPQLFVSFSDPLPDRPAVPLRERTQSSPATASSLGVALSGLNPTPKPAPPADYFSLNSPVTQPAPKPSIAHLGRSPLRQPYRKPSEDPAWSLDEPVKPVTEDHVKALYQSPNYNIEELNEDVASGAAPTQETDSLAESYVNLSEEPAPAEPAPVEKPRQQHGRSNSSPAVLPPPITVPPRDADLRLSSSINLPPRPAPGLERFQSTPAAPTTRTDDEGEPHFEEDRPWAGLNDLFLEATRVMTRLHTRSESSDSALLAPPVPKTNPSTPPVTPVTAAPTLPAPEHAQDEDEDDSQRNDDLASTLYDSSELVQPMSVPEKVIIKVVDVDAVPPPLANESAKWGFMFFGLVGGMVIGSMLSRGRV